MADDILLIMAKREGRYIAGALNFIGGDTLFGRNWGCVEDHRFLHFEVCYYQAIDFAIARGLHAWRQEPKVVTKWSEATCQRRPSAPTGLLTRDSEMPSPAS